jgi:hypothetical protein
MKYLKSYTLYERVSKKTKIFESSDPTESKIYQDIHDILLELNDNGIWTEIVPVEGYDPITFDAIEDSYEVTIQGAFSSLFRLSHHDSIKWGDIEEVALRLIDYLESEGYSKLSIKVDYSVDRENKEWVNKMKTFKYKQEYEFDSLTFYFSK